MILNSPYVSGSITVTGNSIVSGSITVLGGLSGSNAVSASYALSASNAATASSADNFLARGTITAQTLFVQTITSSIDYVTGSTRFGSLLTDTHVFSGSVTMNPNGLFVSGSGRVGIGTTNPTSLLTVNGVARITATGTTAQLQIFSPPGSGSFLYFAENTVADRGVIGYAAGSGDLVYRSGASTLSDGTERLRITSGGNFQVTGSALFSSRVNVNGATDNSSYALNILGSLGSFQVGTSGAELFFTRNDNNDFLANAGSSAGIRLGAQSYLRFSTGTSLTERLYISSTGVATFTGPQDLATFASTNATNLYIAYKYNTSTTVGYIGNGSGLVTGNSSGDFGIRAESALFFAAGGNAERMRITSGGNVGINTSGSTTSTPHLFIGTNMSMFNGASDDSYVGSNFYYNSAWYYRTSNAASQIQQNGGIFYFKNAPTGTAGGALTWSIPMTITSGGNVLIGTSDNSATYRLNVANSGSSAYIGVTNQAGASGDRYIRIGFGSGQTYGSIQGTRNSVADDVNLVLQPGGASVGIGTSTVDRTLTINSGGSDNTLGLTSTNGARIDMVGYGTGFSYPQTRIQLSDAGVYGGILSFWMKDNGAQTNSLTERLRISQDGFTMSVKAASDAGSKSVMNTLNTTCGMIPVPSGTSLYLYNRDAGTNYRVILTSSTYFTGQHGNKPVNSDLKTNLQNYIGLIVSSAGTFYSVNPITQEVTTGKEAIQISESLPEVVLTDKDMDKAVWGVVTNVKNDNYNTDGTVETDNNSEWGDRLGSDVIRINGLGEGAIWVTNINGNIENGDYICSSIIPGYGRKQNDDLLHNYTVAKSTMDCDFDLNNDGLYVCEEFEFEGQTYKKAFIGCTYHCS